MHMLVSVRCNGLFVCGRTRSYGPEYGAYHLAYQTLLMLNNFLMLTNMGVYWVGGRIIRVWGKNLGYGVDKPTCRRILILRQF